MTYKGLCVFSIFALFTLLGTNQLSRELLQQRLGFLEVYGI